MSLATVARPLSDQRAHYYTRSGEPMHTVMGKTTGRPRPTNVRDARELDLIPSVTTILKVIAAEGLVNWRIEQAVLAVVTSPRLPGEPDDAFINRVLNVERVQDQERQAAADRGTLMHDTIAQFLTVGGTVNRDVVPWVMPVIEHIMKSGKLHGAEVRLVGNGYAGTADSVLRGKDYWRIWDYKCKKDLPKKGAWPEHQLQLSAYGRAHLDSLPDDEPHRIFVGNVYISTVDAGKFVVCETDNWHETYERGFRPIVDYWYWANDLPR